MKVLNRSAVFDLACGLGTHFSWACTDEGYDYWFAVYSKLIAISEGRNPKPKENWVTPTDEDSRKRPNVEVRDNGDEDWVPAILLAVDEKDDSYPFFVRTASGDYPHAYCRMKVSE